MSPVGAGEIDELLSAVPILARRTEDLRAERRKFDQEISGTYLHPAFPALGAEGNPAYQRDIVIPCYIIFAMRASRRRRHYRFVLRQSVYADIQETADY